MKHTTALAFLCALLLTACPQVDPSKNSKNTNNQSTTNNATSNNDTTADAGGGDEDAAEQTEEDMAIPLGEIPDAIDSTGARFAGVIPAGDRVTIDLTVFQADRATLWLRKVNGTEWDPSMIVFREDGTQPLTRTDPDGNADASIPSRPDQVDEGYEFFYSGTYPLQLTNRGDQDGEFEFTLECLGGPCAVEGGDADLDGIEDGSDDCPYNPGECDSDPWSAESDGTLESSIRADHSGHDVLNYVEARVHMFAWIDNFGGEVEGVYTGKTVRTVEIPDTSLLNTEHTWPQSRSGGDSATESDLHHLYPTDPLANQERASLNFGDVTNPSWEQGGARAGDDATGNAKFEPRDEHKGNAARAMFYYAVIYRQDIPSWEESVLRDWHTLDPVDDAERRRNQAIAHVQGSRNPFVDYPDLVERISDF